MCTHQINDVIRASLQPRSLRRLAPTPGVWGGSKCPQAVPAILHVGNELKTPSPHGIQTYLHSTCTRKNTHTSLFNFKGGFTQKCVCICLWSFKNILNWVDET